MYVLNISTRRVVLAARDPVSALAPAAYRGNTALYHPDLRGGAGGS